MAQRQFIGIKEASETLDFSVSTLRRWISSGIITCYRAGATGQIRFDRAELIRALDRSQDEAGRPSGRGDPSHS